MNDEEIARRLEAEGRKRERRRLLWPAMGFVMAVALGVIAWSLAPMTLDFVRQRIPNFTGNELPGQQMRLAFTALIFLMLAGLSGILLAIFIPRKSSEVRDQQMAKARNEMLREREKMKLRRQKMARENTKISRGR